MLNVQWGSGNMSKKPITVYWSPAFSLVNPNELSLLYAKPKPLYKELHETRVDDLQPGNVLACPAFSNKYKKTYVFRSTQSSHYEYDYENENRILNTLGNTSFHISGNRYQALSFGPTFLFSFYNIFFADEPLNAFFTPPYYHEPKYTKYGSVIPGEFDIGQWFRPFSFEMQTWKNKGEIIIEEEEPLFYVEFKTDRPIIFKQFVMNEKLAKYAKMCAESTNLIGFHKTLSYRYNKFKQTGLKERILFEIKNNTID